MKAKVIEIRMEDGSHWHIPLSFIAKHRAAYYSQKDGGTEAEMQQNFREEVAYIMEDDFEGIDWLQNNMDWKDVESVARRVQPANPKPPAELFRNAEHKIITPQPIQWDETFLCPIDGSKLIVAFDAAAKNPATIEYNGDWFKLTVESTTQIIESLEKALDDLMVWEASRD